MGGLSVPYEIPRLAVSGLRGLAEFKNHLAGVFWPSPPELDQKPAAAFRP